MVNEQVVIKMSIILLLIPFIVGASSVKNTASTKVNNPELAWTARKTRATQYHTSANGAYQYGYTGPHHTKSESSFNGVTRGGYSYIDANGLMQTVSYTADSENGFRVQASNLPNQNAPSQVEDTPEVAIAKLRHLDQLRRAESWQSQRLQQNQRYDNEQSQPTIISRYQKRPTYILSADEARSIPAPPRPYINSRRDLVVDPESNDNPRRFTATSTSHYATMLPAAVVSLPIVQPLIHSSMRHSQDSLGQYEYSYTGDTSAKTESRSLDGTTRGAYSYIDANGLLQQVHYIADRDGFRVLATNLPEA